MRFSPSFGLQPSWSKGIMGVLYDGTTNTGSALYNSANGLSTLSPQTTGYDVCNTGY